MAEVPSIAVVIADDDEDDNLMVKSAIANLHSNYSVTIVGNGIELIKYLDFLDKNKKDLPGLVLLDINMPMKNGKETLQEIREHPKYRLIPVVMLTSSKDRNEIESCYRFGAAGYLTKPYTIQELEKKIDAVLTYWLEIVEHPILD